MMLSLHSVLLCLCVSRVVTQVSIRTQCMPRPRVRVPSSAAWRVLVGDDEAVQRADSCRAPDEYARCAGAVGHACVCLLLSCFHCGDACVLDHNQIEHDVERMHASCVCMLVCAACVSLHHAFNSLTCVQNAG